jgi:hypothetical protein
MQEKPVGVFDDKQVTAAIARLPTMPTKGVREILDRARTRKIVSLETACEAELESRPFEFTGDEAARFSSMGKAVAGMSLVDAMRHAFGVERRPNETEMLVIRWIAAHPGTSFEETKKHYGKGDLGLVIGHLVYDRYGCFRAFVDPKQDQSSVLLSKDASGRSVRYTLQPEAEQVFRELGFI